MIHSFFNNIIICETYLNHELPHEWHGQYFSDGQQAFLHHPDWCRFDVMQSGQSGHGENGSRQCSECCDDHSYRHVSGLNINVRKLYIFLKYAIYKEEEFCLGEFIWNSLMVTTQSKLKFYSWFIKKNTGIILLAYPRKILLIS